MLVFFPQVKPHMSFWNHGLNSRGLQDEVVTMLGEVLLSQEKAIEG